MDRPKYKSQHFLQGYRSTSDNSNISPRRGFFKFQRAPTNSMKWRNNICRRERSKFQIRKILVGSEINKSRGSAEDVEEEERRKKLTDTANKLLSKIKSWSAEQNVSESLNNSENISEQNSSQNVTNENNHLEKNSVIPNEGGNNIGVVESKPKRIAHSKTKRKVLSNQTPKPTSSLPKNCMNSNTYNINKRTVKNFQSRIQHKLYNEIMQMPKVNLQNVLNDPKINPVMELKMSRLVQENRPLIAQRLRALAESNLKANDLATNSNILNDIDKLIDPVIEADLSVLPHELIKQMENIFQVQFNYSDGNSNNESEIQQSLEGLAEWTSVNTTEDDPGSTSAHFSVEDKALLKQQDMVILENECSLEDLEKYECSTDEDEEICGCGSLIANNQDISRFGALITDHQDISGCESLVSNYQQMAFSSKNSSEAYIEEDNGAAVTTELPDIDGNKNKRLPTDSQSFENSQKTNKDNSQAFSSQGGSMTLPEFPVIESFQPHTEAAISGLTSNRNKKGQQQPAKSNKAKRKPADSVFQNTQETDKDGSSSFLSCNGSSSSTQFPLSDNSHTEGVNGPRPASPSIKGNKKRRFQLGTESFQNSSEKGKDNSPSFLSQGCSGPSIQFPPTENSQPDVEESERPALESSTVGNNQGSIPVDSESLQNTQEAGSDYHSSFPSHVGSIRVKQLPIQNSSLASEGPGTVQHSAVENLEPLRKVTSRGCQTTKCSRNAVTQTPIRSKFLEALYGAPIPKISTDDNVGSLLEEVNSIRNLINALNERRFMIFVKLAKNNPSGNFIFDDFTSENFIETMSNGSLYLVESLKNWYLRNHRDSGFNPPRPRTTKKKRNRKQTNKGENSKHLQDPQSLSTS